MTTRFVSVFWAFVAIQIPTIVIGKNADYDISQSISSVKILDAKIMSSPYFFRSGPDDEPYFVSDSTCIKMIDNGHPAITFSAGFSFNDIYWDKFGNCLFSDSTNIYMFDSIPKSSTLLLGSNMTHLNFRVGASAIYYYETNDSCLYICNYDNLETSLLYKFDYKICDLKVKGNIIIVACDNKIFLLSGNESYLLLENTESINVVELVDNLIFYGTGCGLFCFDGRYVYKITEGVVEDLSYIKNDLYTIYSDNSAFRIENILEQGKVFLHLDYKQLLHTGKTIIDKDEITLSPNQLCVFPHNGVFLLTGNELISLEENEKMPIARFPKHIIPEEVIFIKDSVYVKNDTTIVSCGSEMVPMFAFDTNQFQMFPATDNNIFILSKRDSISMLFCCDIVSKEVKPFMKLSEDVVYIAGDTTQCILVAGNLIYNIQEKDVWTMLDYFDPIVTATLTKYGLIFATEKSILLLNGMNNVALIAERGCRRLLSDDNSLYIFYDDGTLLSYNLDLLNERDN